MSLHETVTLWLDQLKAGDEAVVHALWQRYFDEMVIVARRKLRGHRGASDEEDIALSAFKSFCLGAAAGRYPRVKDRDGLWSLLVAITANKSVDLLRHENRQKRGGRPDNGEENSPLSSRPEQVPLELLITPQPSPEIAAMLADTYEQLLERLAKGKDPQLLDIAVAKMLGESNDQIAERLECSRRTIERKLSAIISVWEDASS